MKLSFSKLFSYCGIAASLVTPLCNAVDPVLLYTFDTDLSDSSGNNGPSLTASKGSVIDGNFFVPDGGVSQSNGGISLDLSSLPVGLSSTYSIEMRVAIDGSTLSYYRKLMDFKNRASDNGLYSYYGNLKFYPFAPTVSGAFTEDQYTVITVARDDVTKTVDIFANGGGLEMGTDTNDDTAFVSFMHFLADDNSTAWTESATAKIDYIKIYDVALTSEEAETSYEAGGTSNASPTGGAGGDPHITSWSGHRFDYHGHCDLLLFHSPHFGQGHTTQPHDQGLSVHIRSAPYKVMFSYISDIAIQIGDSILEIGSNGEHYVDGELQQVGSTQKLGGYNVGSKHTKNGRYVYHVHLGDNREKKYHGQELTIREYKEWITISVHHPSTKDFVDTIGLMGSYPHGTWLGRDGITLHNNVNDFGSDWIVLPDVDGHLFREQSPFPDKCEVTSTLEKTSRRRLSASSVTKAQALEACAKLVPTEALEGCIMDVLIADDLDMAEAAYGLEMAQDEEM
mmetsp:Transcript_1791/g.3945  ORF Transcript_1791/g.3945 Transcript_1791/m.3945 type:complete len:509 (-) Transcript_1791:98-1624(-)|eukprot:scaffold336_cov196-Amphora_coffeaeformis.AAC.5